MKLGGRRDCTVPQRCGTEIDPKRNRVTADPDLLPRGIDPVGTLRPRPVKNSSLYSAGDQKPKSSIPAPDDQQRGKDY
jgi:hypothetical protein